MSHVMRKPVYAICVQQRRRSVCASAQSDQRLCFRFLDSIIPLLSISEIPSLYLASVAEQAGLSLSWSQTPKTGFLLTRLELMFHSQCLCSNLVGHLVCYLAYFIVHNHGKTNRLTVFS